MKKTILYILDYYTPHKGWVETVFEHVIPGVVAQGYQVVVLTSQFDVSLPVYEDNDSVHIYRIAAGRKWFQWKAIWMWLRLCRKYDISFIHTTTYGGAFPSWIVGFFAQKKVLLTVHEIFGSIWFILKPWYKALFYRFFEWCIFHLSFDHYHCVSTYTLNTLRVVYGVSDSKISRIYNGVNSAFWSKDAVSRTRIKQRKQKYQRDNRFVIGYYGHSGSSKWLDYLVDWIKRTIEMYPDAFFVFNLIHAQRDKYMKRYIQSLKLHKNVQIYSGFSSDDLRTFVASVDVMVAPSLSEGFGFVHAETSCMETSLITTNVASIPEVVWWSVKFISPQSSSQIVDAIQEYREKWFALYPRQSFSWKDSIDSILSLYDLLLKNK